jgi:hypothetical protein
MLNAFANAIRIIMVTYVKMFYVQLMSLHRVLILALHNVRLVKYITIVRFCVENV